ncbi:sugar phosphate isomerase/epimerase family protein [bacterium]
MNVKLGINTGFALNRFPMPEEWIPLVADKFGLEIVQFTADLLNPGLPDDIIKDNILRLKKLSKDYKIQFKHSFTSAFTRVNHLAHPDPLLRKYWKNWFKKFVDISSELGAESMGSHAGIFSVQNNNNQSIKEQRFMQVVDAWHDIAKYAKEKGIKYLTWEPMSIPREMGETIEETKRIQKAFNENTVLPIKLCLDVDHGDVSSENPDDTDPYKWLEVFGKQTALLHIKQTFENKGGHWPFTREYNEQGKITPKKLLDALNQSNVKDITLLLELSFREREPFESRVIDDIKESIEYWRPFVNSPGA